MWYVPKPDLELAPERDRKFRGETEVAFLRSKWFDTNATFASIKAGYNQVNHGHLDMGNFIVDALGERWAKDLGSDDYNLPGYWDKKEGGQRWTYYRLNSKSHNVPLINGKNQDTHGTSKLIGFRSEGPFPYAIVDLSTAYTNANTTGKITRGIALVNERNDVLIQDEYDLDRPRFLQWGMTTYATIELHTDGTAMLSLNGKQLRATVLSPSGWQFGIESAEQPPPQRANKGASRLVVRPVYETAQLRMAILLSPVREGEAPMPTIMPIAEW